MSDRQIDKSQLAMRFSNVGLSYVSGGSIFGLNRYWALKDLSFDLYKGETLGVIGRNGAGKSTLLRLMAGVYAPDKGVVEDYGLKASLLSLQLGFVSHLTGRQNVINSGLLLGMDKAQCLAKMNKIEQFADIGDFFDRPVRMYSSGMRARLGFSIAIEADPDILLIDEVLGVGDLDFKRKSSLAMKQRIRSNKTVVIVSHATDVLRQLCDRVIWLENQTLKQEGDVETVLEGFLKEKHRRKKKARNDLLEAPDA